MKKFIKEKDNVRFLVLVMFALAVSGCSNVQPDISDTGNLANPREAYAAYEQADSRGDILIAIDLLKSVAAGNPGDYKSRARLANAYTLFGAGYARSSLEKESAYASAMYLAEQAMRTAPAFAKARDEGKELTAAVELLDASHIEALEFWKTALFYDFRECTELIDKISRYPRLKQAVAIMSRIEAIDRNAIWGSNIFSEGIYYLAQPEFLGGDRARSAELLAEAVAISDRSILPRWGRAKYYALAMRDYELFKDDLKWVVAQPLDNLVGFRPWNVLLKAEASSLLANPPEAFGV